MLGPAFPGGFVHVHFPPHADEFSGLEPGHAAQLIWLIEIEFHTSVREGAGALGQRAASGVSMRVKIFIALLAQRLMPPSHVIAEGVKRGSVRAHRDFAAGRNIFVAIAESQPLVEDPEGNLDALGEWRVTLELYYHLGMPIANHSFLTPRLLPTRVGRAAIDARDGAVMGLVFTAELTTQIRLRGDRPAYAT